MKKSELIETLREAARMEEGASAEYLSVLSDVTREFGLGEQELAMVKSRIDYLIAANNYHRHAVREAIAAIEAKPGDDV